MEAQEVTLTFFAPEARVVQVAGTFNGWHPEANPMQLAESEDWTVRLLLRAGQYEYRFVVDGVWTDDPLSTPRTDNSYGGHNSVLKVGLDDRTDLL